ncbi:MAG: cytochrome ubiquinol oxidase subunit I [Acidimicrobiia bacterium]|nr:cytochrome ubiquinol oxidase subunit I [Acidimicrobiia bacterium]
MLLAVDPVPWARAQMAFTLGVHIILVPLGVAWAFMILVAERKAIRNDDEDARLLARRWSKVLAVTFAVGAVTGTVLTFEFGLLWPHFMGRFGDAFGIPFAVEGLFFFLEAIFLAIYIYGWDRLSPRAHFWSGVPIVVSGIGGTASVIAANAWMNQPAGFTLNAAGKVVKVDALEVIFNRAFPYETVHMLVAAYLVGGFMIASVYAVAMLRGRRDRYHRLGFLIAFTVAAISAPVQMVVGDFVAHSVYQDDPVKFAAIELVDQTGRNVPEVIGGYLDDRGRLHGGIKIPGVASLLSGYSTSTKIAGLRSVPADERPTYAQVNTVHLAWDLMVGIGSALAALAAWFGFVWWRKRDLPKTRWFLRAAAAAGAASVVALEAGWVVTEVGRQPWIVRDFMRVEDAATTDQGVWITFLIIVAVYTAVAAATILVVRSMTRRWRAGEAPEGPGPYGPKSVAS